MKKNILKLFLSILFVTILLTALFLTAHMPNKHENGFTRYLLNDKVKLLNKKYIEVPLTHISGISSEHIFFGTTNPQGIIMLSKDLADIDTLVFNTRQSPNIMSSYFIRVDSPKVKLYANNLGAVLYGELNKRRIDTLRLGVRLFTRAIQVSPSDFVVRTFNDSNTKQVFKRINSLTRQTTKEAAIIEEQSDLGFSTDGQLLFDSISKCLLYVQYFQNRFYCVDTNLNLLYKGRTIDTNFSNSTQTKIIQTSEMEGNITPTKARILVNKSSYLNNKFLFIISALKADNEKLSNFNKQTVIDIYEIKSGKYIGSFYIPKIDNKPVKFICISNNLLVALYDGIVGTFKMPDTYPTAMN